MIELESEQDVEGQLQDHDNQAIEQYLQVDRNEYINRDEYNMRDSTSNNHYASPILEDQREHDETMRQTNKRTPARGYNTKLYPNAYL